MKKEWNFKLTDLYSIKIIQYNDIPNFEYYVFRGSYDDHVNYIITGQTTSKERAKSEALRELTVYLHATKKRSA